MGPDLTPGLAGKLAIPDIGAELALVEAHVGDSAVRGIPCRLDGLAAADHRRHAPADRFVAALDAPCRAMEAQQISVVGRAGGFRALDPAPRDRRLRIAL